MEKIIVGTGVLSWQAHERRSDRYGSVGLLEEGGNSLNKLGWLKLDVPEFAINTPVVLKVKILETRESTHIGDLFRGFTPSTPNVGDECILGAGNLFVENGAAVGVTPSDGRDSDWLNPEILYKIHEQTVELYIEAE